MKSRHERSNRKHLGRFRQSRTRRLLLEPLEDRRMLSMVTSLAGSFDVSDLPSMPLGKMEPAGEAATVELISRAHPDLLSETAGVSGTTDWSGQTISGDGRYVTFASYAQNLVSGLEIVPGVSNVYRFDRQTGEVLLVSIKPDGTGSGNGLSETPTISADGSIVAFRSRASNLHALDTDTNWDIFARDLSTGTTHLVSINTEGTGSGSMPSSELVISADGSVVAFRSQAPNLHLLANTRPNIFARDLIAGETHLVSVNKDGNDGGNSESFHPSISADGSVIAFKSRASNLHEHDTDIEWDVFARNLLTNTTYLVSVNKEGNGSGNGASENAVISADGSTVAFHSTASNLHDQDTNPQWDVFARHLTTGTTHLVSINKDGNGSGNGASQGPVISADGSIVAFASFASNLDALDIDDRQDIFARNLNTDTTHLVSVNKDGTGGSGGGLYLGSYGPAISADGSVVAFYGTAANLHPLDTDSITDVFVRDIAADTTYLASVNKDGTASGSKWSALPVISADGTAVAFYSDSADLVEADFNGSRDLFVHVLASAHTTVASRVASGLWPAGAGGNSSVSPGAVTPDGRYVAFTSDAPNLVPGLDIVTGYQNVYRFDRQTGEMLLVSVNKDGTGSGNSYSLDPVISADGSVVAFRSLASNLHAFDTDAGWDVFARNLITNTTYLVSINATNNGSGNSVSTSPSISADGTIVVFQSYASNLHALDTDMGGDIFARHLTTGTTHLVSVNADGDGSGNGRSETQVISADGSVVAFRSQSSNLHALDTDTNWDVFARNLTAGTTHLVSVNTEGDGSGNGESDSPVISADGTVVAFRSQSSNLHALDTDTNWDIFARKVTAGTTHLVSVNTEGVGSGDGASESPVISADGSVVAFRSQSSNLHALDTDTNWDIFARNLTAGTTHLVSANTEADGSGNGASESPVVSADGAVVAFRSQSSNLHALDTDTNWDIFARNLNTGTTHLVSVNKDGTGSGNGLSESPVISANSSVVAFTSRASNLVDADYNEHPDVFALLLDLPTTGVSVLGDDLVITDIAGGDTDDAITLSTDGTSLFVHDPNHILGTSIPGAQGSGTHTITVPLSAFAGSIIVNSLGGDDTLTIDFSGGNPIPVGGLSYNGGDGEDLLTLLGSGTEAVTYTPTPDAVTPGAGVVVVDGTTIAFTGLEPINVVGADTFALDLPGADDVVYVAAGALAGDPAADALVFTGTSGGVAFEAAHLRNTMNVLVDTTTVDGDDTISVTGADNTHGNTNLTILTGAGDDRVHVNGGIALSADGTLSIESVTVNLPNTASSIAASGSGEVSITALKNIALAAGSSIAAVDGDITLSANQQTPAASGDFVGVDVDGGTIESSGSGTVTIHGRGGDGAGGHQCGVQVRNGGQIIGGDSGDGVVIVGTGGANHGVQVSGSLRQVTSTPIPVASPGRTYHEYRNDYAFAALKSDGSVVTWGHSDFGGDSSSVAGELESGVSQIFSTSWAFAALKSDGSVVTWGYSSHGGDSSSVADELQSGVSQIFSGNRAFAALKTDGSVVTWGDSTNGGDSSSVAAALQSGVTQIFSTIWAFAALKSDGSVVTWGDSGFGGNSSSVAAALQSGVTQIFSTGYAFAALKSDGSVVTWGSSGNGGGSSSVVGELESGVSQIFSADWAFAALKNDGSVVTWGHSDRGGDSSSVAAALQSGVFQIFSTQYAFAALKSDGSVVTWGDFTYGGDSSSVAAALQSGVSQIFSTYWAFAALKSDGSVVTWGSSGHGGDSSSVAGALQSGVSQIFSTQYAFAALKSDGSVVAWGHGGYGGNSGSVAGALQSGVSQIVSTGFAFAALKSDGSVVTWGNSNYGGNSSSAATALQSDVVGFANPFTDDWLIMRERESTIISRGGSVSVTGIAGGGADSLAVRLADNGAITTDEHGGNVSLVADSLAIDATAAVSADGPSSVTIAPYEAGVAIDLGSKTAGALGLTDEELARITAGTLIMGSAASGTITITAPITRLAPTHVELHSGAAIIFDSGSLDTAGGNLLLAPGTGGVQPITSGTDIDVGAAGVSFAAGAELAIRIEGTTVDSQYSQLNVAGTVDLTGTMLALSGSYTPAVDDTFTTVTSGGMTGTFTGLPEGAVIANFLGSGRNAVITYVGGDGNDVVLSVENQLPIMEHLIVAPDPVTRGDELTVTAVGVSDPDGVVERFEFWLGEVGGDGTLLGEGVQQNGGWALIVPGATTLGWDLGENTFYARAQDNDGAWSELVSMTLTVLNSPPVVANLTASPELVTRPAQFVLTADDVSDLDGTVVLVEFYREKVTLGTVEAGSGGWSWSGSTDGWPVGEFEFTARAQDNDGAWSEWASVMAIFTSWQNPINPFDVNGDNEVTPEDVVILINEINWRGARTLPPRTMDDLERPYFDVTGKGNITPKDALVVINYLNQVNNSDGGEGESVPTLAGGGVLPGALTVGWFDAGVASGPGISPMPQPSDAGMVADPADEFPAVAMDRDDARRLVLRRAFGEDGWWQRQRELPEWEGLLDEHPADYEALDALFAAWG